MAGEDSLDRSSQGVVVGESYSSHGGGGRSRIPRSVEGLPSLFHHQGYPLLGVAVVEERGT